MKIVYIRLLVCFIVVFLDILPLYAQQYQWANGGGTTISDVYYDNHPERTQYICTDANGNVYALSNIGYYDVYADTSFIGYSYEENANMVVTSYNCEGKLRWSKIITSSASNSYPLGIIADTSGHIYVGGSMPGDILHIGSDTTISNPYEVLGIVQFDTSGHFNWITYAGNGTLATTDSLYGTEYGALALDNANNAHLIVTTRSNVVIVTGDTTHLGTYDLMFNTSGSLSSIKRLQLDSTLVVFGATIEKQSNKLYIEGDRNINYWTDYGGDSTAYNFIAAFDTFDNKIWIDTIGTNYNAEGLIGGITTDDNGHLYLCGGGNGYLTYRNDTMHSPIGVDGSIGYVMKLDTAANKEWISLSNSYDGVGYIGLAIGPNNKLCATGDFNGNMDAKTITGVTITYTGGAYDNTFFSILDTAGNILNVQDAGGTSYYDAGWSVTSDKTGNFYIGGAVANCIPSDTVITPYCSIGGNTDFFVLKYGVDCGCTSMPVCNYSYSVTGASTVHVTYTGTVTPAIDSVVWSFGDAPGGVSTVGATDTGLTATHVYTTIGTVNLCATVYTGCGSDIQCHSFLVNCTGSITAAFTDTGSTIRGFTYTGTTAVADSIDWNFGDGTTATGTTAIHSYTASATYTVCVTAHTACGSNTVCNTVTVDCTPTASFTNSGSSPVNFTYTGSTASVDSVTWNYGDGYMGDGTTASHIYSASGIYTVCVTNHTSCGEKTICKSVIVDCTPVAAFTDTGSTIKGFTYTGSPSTAAEGLDSVVWNFGDGSAATGNAVTHVYSASGTYTVCATVFSTCGSNTVCQAVTADCTPISSYTYSGLSTITFDFTGFPSTAAEGLDSVLWIFGDGPTATGLTVVHAYTSTGTFTPCAEVFSACGHDMYCKSIFISCLANASFAYTNLSTGTGNVTFTYTGSTTEIDSVVWYFGDGTTDTGLNPQHTYADTNVYNVCAILYSACGIDSSCNEVAVGTEGVPIVSNANIQVFPNPTGDQLNITGVIESTNYRLLSITGVCVQNGVLHSGSNGVVLGNVVAGVYVLEMTNAEGRRDIVRVVKE